MLWYLIISASCPSPPPPPTPTPAHSFRIHMGSVKVSMPQIGLVLMKVGISCSPHPKRFNVIRLRYMVINASCLFCPPPPLSNSGYSVKVGVQKYPCKLSPPPGPAPNSALVLIKLRLGHLPLLSPPPPSGGNLPLLPPTHPPRALNRFGVN